MSYFTNDINNCDFMLHIVDNIKNPVLWTNEIGTILYYNMCVSDYINDNDLKSLLIYRLSSDIKKTDWEHLLDILKEKDTHQFKINFYNKRCDILINFLITSFKIKINDNYYFLHIFYDITDNVLLENQLNKEKIKNDDLEKIKNSFLSNISHEIRTPMNSIVGFSDILNNMITNDLKEYTKIIIENSEYLLSLIDNIIMISRIDSNQINIIEKEFDVLNTLNNIKNEYDIKLKKVNKNINIIIDNNNDEVIYTDEYIIINCLYKLIDNSIKYSNKNINIGFYKKENSITIYVKDDGIGIDKKFHNMIFDRFKKVNQLSPGSGLGLSIFKLFVNLLNGNYNIESEIGKGTIISFTLNLNENLSTNMLKNKTVLIDNNSINKLLNDSNLKIFNLTNLIDYKKTINKISKLDFAIIDIDDNVLIKQEIITYIKMKFKKCVIISTLTYEKIIYQTKLNIIGIDEFVIKPINKKLLINILNKNKL